MTTNPDETDEIEEVVRLGNAALRALGRTSLPVALSVLAMALCEIAQGMAAHGNPVEIAELVRDHADITALEVLKVRRA